MHGYFEPVIGKNFADLLFKALNSSKCFVECTQSVVMVESDFLSDLSTQLA